MFWEPSSVPIQKKFIGFYDHPRCSVFVGKQGSESRMQIVCDALKSHRRISYESCTLVKPKGRAKANFSALFTYFIKLPRLHSSAVPVTLDSFSLCMNVALGFGTVHLHFQWWAIQNYLSSSVCTGASRFFLM